MKKSAIFLLIFFILSFISIFIYNDNLRNKLSQEEFLLKSYSLIKSKFTKIKIIYDKKIEYFLLTFSKKHQFHWTVEDKNQREKLKNKISYLGTKNPSISIQNENDLLIKDDWYRSHGNHSSIRFSELNLINKDNVKNLEIAWILSSGEPGDIQCNPIAINGIVYTPISGNYIAAINGFDGKIIWKTKKFKSSLAKRGMIYWKNEKTKEEKIFFSNGKNLISLIAKDGTFDKNFGSNGIVRTGLNLVAPAIYDEKIIIPTLDKYIEVYDIHNGKMLWKLKYRRDISGRIGGVKYNNSGGTPWSGSSLDEKRGIFYITTGNPGYYFDGTRRPGLNGDANSIIAIDLKKKKKIWSFQETSHDIWNLDIASPPILAKLKKDEVNIDVVIAPSKTGNTIILDRVNGEPIYDYTLKKVETSTIPGERTSPYQLEFILPEPFEKVFLEKSDIRSKFLKKYSSDEFEYGKHKTVKFNKTYIRGGIVGGAQWVGGSVDPKKNILFVTSNNIAFGTKIAKTQTDKNKKENFAPKYISKLTRLLENNKYPINKPPWGTINAINLNDGKLLWKKPLGNFESFNENKGVFTGTENFGGTLATRGDITITSGTLDKKIYFHDTNNGDLLHSLKLPFIGSSPPTTYIAKNEQFIILHATGGMSLKAGYPDLVKNGDTLIALKLKE